MIALILLCMIVLVLLVLIAALQPARSTLSTFELKRRHAKGDATASAILRSEQLHGDLLSLQRIASAFLLVVFVLLCVGTFGWVLGTIIASIVAFEYGAIARIGAVQRFAQKLYKPYEAPMLRFVEKYTALLRFVRLAPQAATESARADSREEFMHLVEQSSNLFTSSEKQLITHSLSFETKKVSEVMTPRGVIDSISKKELLGPLTLDGLHKLGHSRFPVTDGDIDHVVGTLFVQDLLTLDTKRSITAEKAMEPRVYYIHEGQTLTHALAAFLRTHHHLFIVVNEFRETVGLVSLEDVLEALLGRKIIDEFDTHEDLRIVAARNIRQNNQPAAREDV